MNIVLLTSSYALHAEDSAAAAGLFVRDFSELLAKQGHQVRVVTQGKNSPLETPPAVDVHAFAWSGGDKPLAQLSLQKPRDLWVTWEWFRQSRKALLSIQKEGPVDHILAFWAVPAGWLAMKSGLPYSVWCLGSDIWTAGRSKLLSPFVIKTLQKAHRCYADGLELAKEAGNLSGRSVQFLASSRKLPSLEKDSLHISRTQPRFLFLGRYAPVKGCDILLEAMAHYGTLGGTGHLQLRGGGPMEKEIRDRAQKEDLKVIVEVGGLANREEAAHEILACDVLIIPSRQESIPLVLSDALQCGKAVIVTDVGDMGTLVRAHRAGLVVPPQDVVSLAQALLDYTDRFQTGVEELAAKFHLEHSVKHILEDLKGGDSS